MPNFPRKPDLSVVPIQLKTLEKSVLTREFPAVASSALSAAGSEGDPRTKEAMRLIEAFLAIEDATARASLITLAERLVSYDWLRKTQQR